MPPKSNTVLDSNTDSMPNFLDTTKPSKVNISTVKDEISIACNDSFTRYLNHECDSVISDLIKKLQDLENSEKLKKLGVTLNYKTSENTLTVFLSSSGDKKYSTTGILTEDGKSPTLKWDELKEE